MTEATDRENELHALIAEGEGERLEFKTSLAEQNAVIETLTAFAHKSGGTVLIGVKNDGTVVWIDIGSNTLEHLSNEIRQHTELPLQPKLDLIRTTDGRDVLAASIDPSPTDRVHFAFRPGAWIRVGRNNQQMSVQEIRDRLSGEAVPADWWERPGAPQFRVDPADDRGPGASYAVRIRFEQPEGGDVGGLKARWRGAGIQMDPIEPIPENKPRKYHLKPVPADPAVSSDGEIKGAQIGFELQFWWAGSGRHILWIWPIEKNNKGRWGMRSDAENTLKPARRW